MDIRRGCLSYLEAPDSIRSPVCLLPCVQQRRAPTAVRVSFEMEQPLLGHEESVEVRVGGTEMSDVSIHSRHGAREEEMSDTTSAPSFDLPMSTWVVFLLPTLLNWICLVCAHFISTTMVDSQANTYSVELFRTWNFEIVF